jgi:hypothetical protein
MRTWVLGLVATLAGCSSGFEDVSARAGCGDVWEAVCDRYYQCYRPDEIAEIGLPPTAAQCADMLTDQNCANFTDTACGDGTRYHPSELLACTDAIRGVDCPLVSEAPGSVPTCNALCGD